MRRRRPGPHLDLDQRRVLAGREQRWLAPRRRRRQPGQRGQPRSDRPHGRRGGL